MDNPLLFEQNAKMIKVQNKLYHNEREQEKPSFDRSAPARIHSLAHAIRFFEDRMAGKVRKVKDINLDGSRIGRLYLHELLHEKMLLLFKRDPYFMFSKHFPEASPRGYGVMNNRKLTHWCAMQVILLTVMFKDGRCYKADAMEFYLFYEEYGTEVVHVDNRDSRGERMIEIAAPLGLFEAVY